MRALMAEEVEAGREVRMSRAEWRAREAMTAWYSDQSYSSMYEENMSSALGAMERVATMMPSELIRQLDWLGFQTLTLTYENMCA